MNLDYRVAHGINRTLIEQSGWELLEQWRSGTWTIPHEKSIPHEYVMYHISGQGDGWES